MSHSWFVVHVDFDSFLNDVSLCFVNLAIEIYSVFLLKDKIASGEYLF